MILNHRRVLNSHHKAHLPSSLKSFLRLNLNEFIILSLMIQPKFLVDPNLMRIPLRSNAKRVLTKIKHITILATREGLRQ